MFSHAKTRAVSLVELLTVVSILGVLASIAVPHMDVLRASHDQLALDAVEQVNRAVLHYEQVYQRFSVAGNDATTLDEIAVLYKLTHDNPGIPGYSPYPEHDFPSASSDSSDDYRMAWTGRNFRLLVPGATGVGIKIGGN
jgi:prepilin-type N-terminal cleavage/methylation domain-containing protein